MEQDDPAPQVSVHVPGEGPARGFAVRPPGKSWAAKALIGVNFGVFAAMLLAGVPPLEPGLSDVLRFGANHGPYVAHGDWWRLASCMFVHIGILHLLVNMFSLGALRIVESFYGNGAFVLLYLAAGLGGSITSALWNPSGISAGASGAIFGIAGAFAAYFLAHRSAIPEPVFRPVMRNLLLLLLVNILFGLSVPGIDNAAHLGGLATGCLAGRALDREPLASAALDRRRLARIGFVFALLAGLCTLIPGRAASAEDIHQELVEADAQRLFSQGKLEEMRALVDQGLAKDPSNPGLLALRAELRLSEGDPRAALADLDAALYLRPEDDNARELRVHLEWLLGRPEEALEDAQLLGERHPELGIFRQVRGEILYSLRRWKEAAAEFAELARSRGPDALEGQLFLWLSRARMGEEASATRELAAFLAVPTLGRTGELEGLVGGLFTGQMPESELLSSLDRADSSRVELTRLYFFTGSLRLVRGDTSGAQELLRKALERGTSAESTWLLARTELERLKKP